MPGAAGSVANVVGDTVGRARSDGIEDGVSVAFVHAPAISSNAIADPANRPRNVPPIEAAYTSIAAKPPPRCVQRERLVRLEERWRG